MLVATTNKINKLTFREDINPLTTLTYPLEWKSRNYLSPFRGTYSPYNRYTPAMQEIDTRLKAFVPDYIPAIGEVDAFLKMPRPDG